MKLSLKLSLTAGALVLLFMGGMAFLSNMIASAIIEETAEKSLKNQSKIAAQLISEGIVKAELRVLYELANRARTKTMDWEIQRESLLPDIDLHNYLDFAIVDLDGTAHYIKDGSVSNLADRDYIVKVLAGQQVISDVLISRVIGKPVVMFAAPIFVDDRVAGALIGRREGTVLTDMTRQIGLGDTGYVYMVNAGGTFICHPNGDLVYSQFNPLEAAKEDPSLRSLAVFIEDVLAGKDRVGEYSFNGKTHIGAYSKVPDTDWFLIGSVEKDELFSEVNRMLVKTLLVGAAAAVAAVFILILVLSFALILPIKAVVAAAVSLAELKFDIDIPRNRKDEIGDVQRAFHTIRDELKKTLTDINNEHMGQKNISGNLHLSIQESSDGLAVIARNMESVQDKTDAQMDSVMQTAESVEGIIKHIRSLEHAVDVQAETISRSSESIERMVEDIGSVRSVVHHARESTGSLSKSSEEGRKLLNNLTGELARIADQSSFLEKANAALVNIAAQTNILAMNAAIEAAHAGETGRGFAVVAGEVRSLAELSNKESASISAEIKNMRDGIEKMRQVSDGTVETLGSMFTEVTDMQASFTTVTEAVEAQASNGARVLGDLTGLRETAEQVRAGSDEIEKESAVIHSVVENLKTISKDVNDSVLDVQMASKKIADSLDIAQKIAEGRYLAPPEDSGSDQIDQSDQSTQSDQSELPQARQL
ncbi:MAG: methyl-accepting chemotaxis protein [Treponema sp.]|jgi:methyl-accepting chemotaxis protein|nr:methyl-accepting chemotaxis protein [Treponema sp.]